MSDPNKPLPKGTPGLNITGGPSYKRADQEDEYKDGESLRVGLSEQILASSSTGEQQVSQKPWLDQLKHDSLSFLDQQASQQEKSDLLAQKHGIETTVDRIFSFLQAYMYEFNKVVAGTDLHMTSTISGDVTEVTRYNKLRGAEEAQTYFRARLSTRLYTLSIRGKEDKIDFFILPVNRAMALSIMENEYSPLATVEIQAANQNLMWRPLFSEPALSSLEELSSWLFQQLVEQTKLAVASESNQNI